MSNLLTSLPIAWRVVMYVLLGVGVVGCWLFVAMYTKAYRWWENQFGQHLVAFTACLGLFLTYYAVRLFWQDMPGRTPIVLSLFVLLDVMIVWRVVLFWRTKSEQDKDGH